MKILSNKAYKNLLSFKQNYNKLVEKKNEEFNNHIHLFEYRERERWNRKWQEIHDEKYEIIEREQKYHQKLEDNIVSLKKKINILVKKTR